VEPSLNQVIILSYLILSYLILSYLILSYLYSLFNDIYINTHIVKRVCAYLFYVHAVRVYFMCMWLDCIFVCWFIGMLKYVTC